MWSYATKAIVNEIHVSGQAITLQLVWAGRYSLFIMMTSLPVKLHFLLWKPKKSQMHIHYDDGTACKITENLKITNAHKPEMTNW